MKRAICAMAVAAAGVVWVTTADAGSDYAKPGGWAYEACQTALAAKIKGNDARADHVQIRNEVNAKKISDHKYELTGEAKYKHEGDSRDVTFRCKVDKDDRQVEHISYDRQ